VFYSAKLKIAAASQVSGPLMEYFAGRSVPLQHIRPVLAFLKLRAKDAEQVVAAVLA
jgi:hypothetical protein